MDQSSALPTLRHSERWKDVAEAPKNISEKRPCRLRRLLHSTRKHLHSSTSRPQSRREGLPNGHLHSSCKLLRLQNVLPKNQSTLDSCNSRSRAQGCLSRLLSTSMVLLIRLSWGACTLELAWYVHVHEKRFKCRC